MGCISQTVALIAEVKHASPSKGVLIENFDPVALGTTYAANGAAAISVLTDQQFFGGSLAYLTQVRAAVDIPVLRKDFIIDPYQVYEARAANADAVLLIVAALADAQLADLHALVAELGMAALVEVHNEAELERALQINPRLIGVNNRDLKTFHEDLGTTGRIAALIPGRRDAGRRKRDPQSSRTCARWAHSARTPCWLARGWSRRATSLHRCGTSAVSREEQQRDQSQNLRHHDTGRRLNGGAQRSRFARLEFLRQKPALPRPGGGASALRRAARGTRRGRARCWSACSSTKS